MAKQTVSAVERHVEKGVLGLTVVMLLGVVLWYGIMQPNTATLGGETVTPSTVDQKVLESAERVKRAVTTADPAAPVIDSPLPAFEEGKDVLAFARVSAQLAGVTPWQPSVPNVARLVPQDGELVLAEVVRSSKPVVISGRSTLTLYPPGIMGATDPGDGLDDEEAAGFIQPSNWASSATTFDLAAQKLNYRRAGYDVMYQEPYLLGLEVQRRERRYDGTWSDDDWQPLETVGRYALPPPPKISLVKEGDRWVATVDSREAAADYYELIKAADKQIEIMRPLLPQPLNGNGWRPPVIAGVDLSKIDHEFMIVDAEQSISVKQASIRYEDLDIEIRETSKKPSEVIKETLQDAEKALKAKSWQDALDTANRILSIQEATEVDRKKAEKIIEEAQLRLKDEERQPNTPKKGDPSTEIKKTELRRSPLQVLWAHDAGQSSLHGGHTYQYRVRARVYNPYFAQPTLLKNPQDATQYAVTGEWSEPSDPVYVEPEAKFFVKGGTAEKRSAKAHLFQWTDGVIVEESFDVAVGKAIAGQNREAIPDNDKAMIEFNTGAVVVDLDFDRQIHEQKSGKTLDFDAKPTETVALVYVDRNGRLAERFDKLDKSDPAYKSAKESVYDEKTSPKTKKIEEKKDDKGENPPPGKGGGRRGGGGGRRG